MADQDGRSAAKLIKKFEKNAHKYGFYQALRWLGHISQLLADQGDIPLNIRILPQLSLDFIGGDIRSAAYDENTHTIDLTVTFLALYGTASPLPTFYTEDLIIEVSDDITVSKDFLDIFHKILYQKLYNTWLKYRLDQQAFENNNQQYLKKLYYLIGLGDTTLRKMVPNAKSLLKYIGLLTQQPRSSKNLETLLQDYFDVPVKVISGYKTMQPIALSQQLRLGQANSRVGWETYLGSMAQDANNSIGIEIKHLSAKYFNLFSYGQVYANALIFLIKFFCNCPIKCYLTIYLKTGEVRPSQLGLRQWGELGQNIWLSPEKEKNYCVQYEVM